MKVKLDKIKKSVMGVKGMNKLMQNRKGFSLIELLIVFAILAVMGVIAFNMYTGMVNNSKLRADEEIAKTIEKALNTYIVDSGDVDLAKVFTAEDCTAASNIPHTVSTATQLNDTTNALIVAMQGEMWNGDNKKPYGPLLTPPVGKDADWDNFKPQGAGYAGYKIELDTKNKCCKVTPSKTNNGFYKIR